MPVERDNPALTLGPADRVLSGRARLLSAGGWKRFWAILTYSALTTGLIVSAVLHLSGYLAAEHVRFGWGLSRQASQGSGPVGLAVVTESELSELQGAALSVETPTVGEPAPSELGGRRLDFSEPSALGDAGVGGSDLGDLGSVMSSATDIGPGLGNGTGTGGGGGGGGASFFGVEASGNRFAYIVDVSGSMSVGGKIEALRAELQKSVSDMLQNSSFIIVPFSSEAQVLGGKTQWTEATDRNKAVASRTIETLKADGGTEPTLAFQIIFSLRPRPDAIFFMTDGEFSGNVPDEVAIANPTRVPIHCLCLVSQGSEGMMKQIASRSGGTYTFLPGPRR